MANREIAPRVKKESGLFGQLVTKIKTGLETLKPGELKLVRNLIEENWGNDEEVGLRILSIPNVYSIVFNNGVNAPSKEIKGILTKVGEDIEVVIIDNEYWSSNIRQHYGHVPSFPHERGSLKPITNFNNVAGFKIDKTGKVIDVYTIEQDGHKSLGKIDLEIINSLLKLNERLSRLNNQNDRSEKGRTDRLSATWIQVETYSKADIEEVFAQPKDTLSITSEPAQNKKDFTN